MDQLKVIDVSSNLEQREISISFEYKLGNPSVDNFRYIILREKATGRYLTFYEKDCNIFFSTIEDPRCAYVFDIKDKKLKNILRKFPKIEWVAEGIRMAPVYRSSFIQRFLEAE
jgi:hypothetical protein